MCLPLPAYVSSLARKVRDPSPFSLMFFSDMISNVVTRKIFRQRGDGQAGGHFAFTYCSEVSYSSRNTEMEQELKTLQRQKT